MFGGEDCEYPTLDANECDALNSRPGRSQKQHTQDGKEQVQWYFIWRNLVYRPMFAQRRAKEGAATEELESVYIHIRGLF
ncbi:hypothetical protein I7I48_09478 [Histoplasma ohiense]|nr:hypothetical protein I7I48_09478 [Histoplasma ohiense (nom. inval.)]